jgi:hypothetical protein
LTSYIRYDIERIVLSDRRSNILTITPTLIETVFNKPGDFLIRKIDISGPELRYLNQLKNLFEKQDANSWVSIAQKFIGISQYVTPLQRGILKDSGDKELREFYASLDYLKAEFTANGANKEKISQEYLLDHLPAFLLNEGRSFIEDSNKVNSIISKISVFKKYPISKEGERKMEVLQALAKEVFGVQIATKAELGEVVTKWYKGLPTPNQNGKFGNEIINRWLLKIKLSGNDDPFELYLETLNENPIKDWEDFSFEKYNFIGRFKDYKRIVEEYTKSPIEVLQIIGRDVFEISATVCSSEQIFDDLFKKWWEQLPKIKKTNQYSLQTNLFISQIILPSAVKARYLETIPQAWKQLNFLAEHIPNHWESWSTSDTIIVAEKYKTCIKEIIDWKPPIEEELYFQTIGKLFGEENINSIFSLYEVVQNWYVHLPLRTRNANWDHEFIFKFFESLEDKDLFNNFVTNDSISFWGLPPFKGWDESILNDYRTRFEILKKKIEDFKRPLYEIVEKIEAKDNNKSSSHEGFCFKILSKIKDSEAFKNKINSEKLLDTTSSIIYDIARLGDDKFTFIKIVDDISNHLSLPNDWHLWTDSEEKSFTKEFKRGIDNLLKWKFPEEESLKKAKVRVEESLSQIQNELSLDEIQMRKVLNDILEGK